MRITKRQLRRIIREAINHLGSEKRALRESPTRFVNALPAAIDEIKDRLGIDIWRDVTRIRSGMAPSNKITIPWKGAELSFRIDHNYGIIDDGEHAEIIGINVRPQPAPGQIMSTTVAYQDLTDAIDALLASQ